MKERLSEASARPLTRHVLVWSAYLLLSIALTWPLAGRLGSVLPGEPADAQIFLWDEWYFRRALLGSDSVFSTTLMFHPSAGVPLAFHTYTPLNGLLGLPLAPILGDLRTHNLLILWSWATAGWGAYLLATRYAKRFWPCFLAGVAFAFCPYRFAHLLGHINLTSIQWLPLFACASVGLLEAKTRRAAVTSGVLAGLMLAANLYTELTYVLFCVMMAVVFVPQLLQRGRDWRLFAQGLGAFVATTLVLALPFVLALRRVSRADLATPPWTGADTYVANLWAWFLPSPMHPLLGERVRAFCKLPDHAESSVFPGYAIWLLAVVGFASLRWRKLLRDRMLPWLVLAVITFALSLGPNLAFGPDRVRVWMPYRLVSNAPMLKNARAPSRFSLLTVLALAMAAAVGLERVTERRSRRTRGVVIGGAFLVSVFDFAVVPYPTFAQHDYATLRVLGREPPGAVLRLPLGVRTGLDWWGRFESETFSEQMVHHKPFVGGMVGRLASARVEEAHAMPLARDLAIVQDGHDPKDAIGPEESRSLAKSLGLRYVLLDVRSGQPAEYFLRQRLFLREIACDDEYLVYRIVDTPDPGHFEPGEGWQPPMMWFEMPFRWMGERSHGVVVAEDGPGDAWCIRISGWGNATSMKGTIAVAVDGAPAGTFTVPPYMFYRVVSAPRPPGATRATLDITATRTEIGDDGVARSINHSVISARPYTRGDGTCTTASSR